jgi:NodT family efflux transporter outer membrane factor (OMF) lipoprotein
MNTPQSPLGWTSPLALISAGVIALGLGGVTTAWGNPDLDPMQETPPPSRLRSQPALQVKLNYIQSNLPDQWEAGSEPASLSPDMKEAPTSGLRLNIRDQFPGQDWWQQFKDPHLQAYLADALAANPDIHLATLRVQELQTMVTTARAPLFPTLTVGGNYFSNRQVTSSVQGEALNSGFSSAGGFISANTTQQFVQTPLRASYEVDLWGRTLLQTQARKMAQSAAEFDLYYARLLLSTELATTYFNLLTLDAMVDLQREVVKLAQQDASAESEKLRLGAVDPQTVEKKKARLAQETSQLEILLQQQALLLHQIAFLRGKKPEEQGNLVRGQLKDIPLTTTVDGGFPAQLLRRRPDIMAAELRFSAARLDHQAAKRALMPTFHLVAQLGYSAVKIGDLFSSQGLLNVLSGSASQTLFQGFEKLATLKGAGIQAEMALETYAKSILSAFKDVDDAFIQLKTDLASLEAAHQEEEATQKQRQITENQYQQGALSGQDRIPSAIRQLKAQQTFHHRTCTVLMDQLSLFKALGGGY